MYFRLPVLCLVSLVASSLLSGASQEIYPLTKLIIGDSEPALLAIPPTAGGAVPVYVDQPALFADDEFRATVAKYIGTPISNDLLNELIKKINEHAQRKDRLIAKVLIPTQDITGGTLRFVVLLGRYSEFTFQGNRWFSSKLLEERLGLKPGDEIRLSTLENAVNWANTNPFRQLKVLINELPNEPGKANLMVGVRERVPFRAVLSVEDMGNELIGEWRYTASLQHGNLWGRDHLASYQFLTSEDPKVFHAHAADYRIPLRWRHFLQFSGSYVLTNPRFGEQGLLLQRGENLNLNIRYTVPLRAGHEPRDVFFGATYKHGNNNLEFDPDLTRYQVFDNATDTFQLFAGFSNVNRDKHGAWSVAATLFASPGNFNSRNTDKALQAFGSRLGASSSYLYGNVAIQRLQSLGRGWDIFARTIGQLATSNIVRGEHLAIGGAATARGYDESIYAAEQGIVFGADLLTPVMKVPLPFFPKTSPRLETRLLAFYDFAEVEYKHRDPSDIPFAALASTGIGIRASLANNFTLSVDYGWQLTELPLPPRSRSRGHVKVMFAY